MGACRSPGQLQTGHGQRGAQGRTTPRDGRMIAADKEEMPLDFTFTKEDDTWKIDRIATVNANVKS